MNNDMFILTGIIVAIVGVFKTMGLPSKYGAITSLAVAAIFILIPHNYEQTLIEICIVGLSAAGVYHLSKNQTDSPNFTTTFITPIEIKPEPKASNRKYGHKPDPADPRDYIYNARKKALPVSVDLRSKMSPIVDQGQLGSCTANGIASGLMEYLFLKAGQPLIRLSRLFLYWQERKIENTISQDSGAYIRDGMKVAQSIGCCPEVDYLYDITRFTDSPTSKADADAAAFKVAEYHRVLTYNDMKAALANGQPVVIGFTVYDSFESIEASNGGLLPTVDKSKESILGGHAVCAVGYNPTEHPGEYIVIRNSWGKDWGDHGYCYMPKSYWDQGLVTDAWTATLEVKQPVTTDDVDLLEALTYYANKGAIDSPVDPVWLTLIQKIKDGTATVEDYRFMPLLFQKVAVFDINSEGV